MGKLERFSGLISGIATLFISVAILAQIATRALGIFLPGAVEMATYAMIAAVFFGLPYTFATRGHIRVTLIASRFHGRQRLALESVSRLIVLIWMGYVTYWSYALAARSFAKGAMTSGLVAVPLWVPQSFIPLGTGLMCVTIVVSMVRLRRGREDLASLYADPEAKET